MGNGLSNARYATLGSFLVNFGTQIYGMATKPNMKDIADATVLQAYWIKQLFSIGHEKYTLLDSDHNPRNNGENVDKEIAEEEAAQVAIQYAPIYALGNLCIAKTFAGIGILDFVDNGGVALQYRAPPSTVVQVLTYAVFPVAAVFSRPLFGTTLVYDLVAMYAGQRSVAGAEDWSMRLGWTALAVGAIVGFKGMMAGWACT
ncbi:hypothetical protein EIP86_003552 [Pleurotus ostreatoroseus]|nr:hypothetical protein EIP86_003552 [Pleurotus ostreatoroseus]